MADPTPEEEVEKLLGEGADAALVVKPPAVMPDKVLAGEVADPPEEEQDQEQEEEEEVDTKEGVLEAPDPEPSEEPAADVAGSAGPAEAPGAAPEPDATAPAAGGGEASAPAPAPAAAPAPVAAAPAAVAAPAAGAATAPAAGAGVSEPAPSPRPPALLPAVLLGHLADPDQSCFVCGGRWQRSLSYRLARDVYMFPLPEEPGQRREWLLSLHWSRASAPPKDARLCSLHFGPSDCRPVPGQRELAQLLPVALPRRRYSELPAATRPCSYPLCRGQRRQLLAALAEIQQKGSAALRRAAKPYWSRRRFPLPEPGPVNQAWVDLFTEALNDRPNVPDEVELSYLCCLHFAPKWFRWENRGRPRQTPEPMGEPKLDKYAEPTIFSTSALIGGLKLALKQDLKLQQQAAELAEIEGTMDAQSADSNEPQCDYPYCGADASPILFTLPSEAEEPERRQVWLRSLRAVVTALGNAADFNPDECHLLCSNHFNEEHISREETDGETIITLDAKATPTRFKRPAEGSVAGARAAKRLRLAAPVVSWPDELGRLVEEAALHPGSDQEQESSEEERDPADSDRLEDQLQRGVGEDGVPEVELHIKMLPSADETPTPRRRGRGRGRPRGRGRGRARLLPSPTPEPEPAPRRPVGRPPSAGTAAQRQLTQVMRAAAAGDFESFRALDQLLAVGDGRPRSSADQVLRMCLMLRLKEGAYTRLAGES